jgi:hypothetical protein
MLRRLNVGKGEGVKGKNKEMQKAGPEITALTDM